MGLFQKPKTEEDIRAEKRYEEAKVRLMRIHETAKDLFYIDEVQNEDPNALPSLIGEVAKGDIHVGQRLRIYDNEGISLGLMEVKDFDTKEENKFLRGKLTQNICTPTLCWDGYKPGQYLADTDTTTEPEQEERKTNGSNQ